MKRHTCGRDTEMTSQGHMNNCGQQPERKEAMKQQLFQTGTTVIRITHELNYEVAAVTNLIWRKSKYGLQRTWSLMNYSGTLLIQRYPSTSIGLS
jgi:hypothetical protein